MELIEETRKTREALETGSNSGSNTFTSSKKAKMGAWRREADKAVFPARPTVPGYAIWLEVVLRNVMDGSGDPIDCMRWWSEMSSKSFAELADSGKFCRWDLKIGTGFLKKCSGHLRRFLFLKQQEADVVQDLVRGRQIAKAIIDRYKVVDHGQCYYDIRDL